MNNISFDDIKKLQEDVTHLYNCIDQLNVYVNGIKSILNTGGAQNIIYTLINLFETQKRQTNEVLYHHFQEDKPIARTDFNPLVSVVMPVYFENKGDMSMHRKYLTESISSIKNQTYSNVEGIIINDGCGDEETELLEEIIDAAGPGIRYFKKENGGTASALNYGIDLMRGEYFAWLSHDDYYYPNHIEVHIEHLRKTLLDEKIITSTMVDIVDENSNLLNFTDIADVLYSKDYKRSILKTERSYNTTTIGGCSVLIPKKVLEHFGGFDPESRATHEYELWRKIEQQYRFFTVPVFTHTYRAHQNCEHTRISNLSDIVMGEKIKILDKVSPAEYLPIYKSEFNFLNAIKDMYYLNCYEHGIIVDYLNRRLTGMN
jgi:glycosyltransferase involved in cell wall biosynthesis